jgi:hypothetical protein
MAYVVYCDQLDVVVKLYEQRPITLMRRCLLSDVRSGGGRLVNDDQYYAFIL